MKKTKRTLIDPKIEDKSNQIIKDLEYGNLGHYTEEDGIIKIFVHKDLDGRRVSLNAKERCLRCNLLMEKDGILKCKRFRILKEGEITAFPLSCRYYISIGEIWK